MCVACVCTRSQRLNNDEHNLWVCADEERGEAKRATVRAQLVEAANKRSDVGKARSLVSNPKAKYTPIAVGSHTEGLASVLREVVPNACLFKGLDFPSSPADETCLPTALFDINRYTMKHIVEYKSGNNLDLDIEKFLDSILKPLQEEVQIIQEQTKDQSGSPEWTTLRKGRITASNCCPVYTRTNSTMENPNTDDSSLVSKRMGYTTDCLKNVKSLKYGLDTEPKAKQVSIQNYTNTNTTM